MYENEVGSWSWVWCFTGVNAIEGEYGDGDMADILDARAEN